MSHDCGDGDGLLSLDAALAAYAREIRALPVETLALEAARARVLATPVVAAVDLPSYPQSAVDGYALHAADLAAASAAQPVRLPLIGEVRAGVAPDRPLPRGATMRIFTGGRMPEGADAIARQEIVTREGDTAILRDALAVGTDLRLRGEELRAGAALADAGQRLDSGLIAALAMAGTREVQVHRQPRVTLLVTGDEVGQEGDAGVFDANGPLLRSWFAERGYAAPRTLYVVDDEALLRAAMNDALANSDLVLTTGGVSVGDHDLVRPVAQRLGVREVFWQVAQKPGKPICFGVFEHEQRRGYLLGLPGNPGAVLIGLHLHVASVLAQLEATAAPCWRHGRLAAGVRADSREQLLRMRLLIDDSGQVQLHKLSHQASHMLSNLSAADALVRIPAGQALAKDAIARWLPLR